jgi:TetR/AcrR family transcriptional regulator, regulator of cefoperazone and chloramphenicol sensitivity
MRQEIHPLQKRTQGLVRELLGPHAKDQDVRFCETIISQCVNPMVVGRKPQAKQKGKKGPPEIKDLAAYADHITIFSIAGIQAVRKETEAKTKKEKHNKQSRLKVKT